ncbi:MAG: DUF11 domain-containing protein [Planctomycetes bacterium]|nr:DUF11 domain-containing protein [Planctomycetota bacterium]
MLVKPLFYYILVRNLGSSAARQVTVEDRIPLGTQLTGTIPRAELREKTVVWKLGTLEPGAEQKIAVRIVPTNEGQIGSVATVNFVAEVSSRTTITAPKLSLEMSGPEQVKLGRPVRFHFKLSNAGSGTASNVYLRSLIPRELRHPAGNDLEYKVGDLPAGQSREIDLTLTAVDEGSAEHKAIITADGGFSIEHSAEVEVLGSQLRLSRTGPKRRYVGRDAVFTNTVANDSTQPIAGVSVVETLPDGMEFVEASDGGTFDARSRTVTWRIDRLEPQSGRELQVTLLAKAAGTMPCDVRATEAGGDTARLTAETQVEGFTALGVRVPENPQPVAVGETLTLRIVAGNKGTEPASHVKVSVEVPPELELVSARGPSRETREGRRVSFAAVEELGGGADEEYQLVLKAVSAGKGDARVQIEVEADELARPLQREEAVYILAE